MKQKTEIEKKLFEEVERQQKEIENLKQALKDVKELIEKKFWDEHPKLWEGDKWGKKYCKNHNEDLKEILEELEE